MKKISAFIIALFCITFLACKKSGPTEEGRVILKKIAELNFDTAEKITNASNEQQAADALLTYSAAMSTLTADAKAFQAKYKNIKLSGNKEYEKEETEQKESVAKYTAAIVKLMAKYPNSEVIEKAFPRVPKK